MKLKARRGAIIVMLGIIAVAMMSVTAISIDFSRMWTLRNELQTSADAAAHAGAVQLSPPNNSWVTAVDSAVRALAAANLAMAGAVTVDSIIYGNWDDTTKTFYPNAGTTDAVSVTVSRQSTGMIFSFLGVTEPRIKARAIGWANAPVDNASGCIKPWAIPYTLLMYRINLWRNANAGGNFVPPNSAANLTRPFEQGADVDALQRMSIADKTFHLKQGSGYMSDSLSDISGNYQSVVLPEYWDASIQALNPNFQPSDGGGMNYANNIAGATCNQLEEGDILKTEQGVAVGPTLHGFLGTGGVTGPGICDRILGHQDSINQSDSRYGDCVNDVNGVPTTGVDVKAAFYYCTVSCNGKSEVEVKLLGSFTLKKIYPQGDNGQNPQWDAAEIVGIFKPVTDGGSVGPGSNTFTTIIIAR